jgi:VWFA-related protein
MSRWAIGCVLAVTTLGVSLVDAAQARTDVDRTVYFTATDQRGAYVEDLTNTDVVVKDGGRQRTVRHVGPSTERLKVSLAIDEGLSPADEVRRAAASLVDHIRDAADVALYRVGSGTARIVDFSADPVLLRRAINAIPYRPQGGGNLIESLYQIVGETRTAEGRRVVIILTTEVAQRSSMAASGVLDLLRDSGTTMHATTLVGPAGPVEPPTPEMAHLENADEVERDRLLNDGPKQSGGLRLSLLRTEALPAALDRIRGELLHQYSVTYTLPAGSKSDGQISLTTTRKGVTLRGPRLLPKI